MLEKRSANKFLLGTAVLALGVAMFAAPAFAQVQDKDQQGCINTMNKSAQKLFQTQGKENSSCIKDETKGKLDEELGNNKTRECLTLDRKGKVAKSKQKTLDLETKKCDPNNLPTLGYAGIDFPSSSLTDGLIVNRVNVDQDVEVALGVFSNSISTKISQDKVEGGCQAAVSKASEKLAATFYKEYNKCVKTGLKDETLDTDGELQACLGADPKSKISKAAGKVTDTVTKKCGGVTLADVFPGDCSGSVGSDAEFGDCVSAVAACRACVAIEQSGGFVGLCDTVDDGVENGSCSQCGNGSVEEAEECDEGAGDDFTPDECRSDCRLAYCGDGVVDTPEACDDGNTLSGDGCDSFCECEVGNPSAKCQDPACPTRGELVIYAGTTGIACASDLDCAAGTCDLGLGVCVTDTRLDTGSHGLSLGGDVTDQAETRGSLLCSGPFAGGPEPCGECSVQGIDPSSGDCRCEGDNQVKCDAPFSRDWDDCGGDVCQCFFGPPLPISSGNIGICALNQFKQDVTGTANVDTGSGAFEVELRAKVFQAQDSTNPCPWCEGDVTAGDGVRDGVCNYGSGSTGPNDGQPCDVDAFNQSFPSTAVGGMSLDCLPSLGTNISGLGLKLALDTTTGTSSLPAPAIPCGDLGECSVDSMVACSVDADCTDPGLGKCNQGTNFCFVQCASGALRGDAACANLGLGTCSDDLLCSCGLCSGDLSVTCTSDAECAAESLGTCSAEAIDTGRDKVKPNTCSDGVCTDTGGEVGECLAGPLDAFCDGVVKANGNGFIECSSNGDCSAFGFGNCTLAKTRPCFNYPVTATGVADPDKPVTVSTFCIPPTTSSGANLVAGLVGPARVVNATTAKSFCGSDPNVQYDPGVGNCP
jgi:cysteine-rich repeat protein